MYRQNGSIGRIRRLFAKKSIVFWQLHPHVYISSSICSFVVWVDKKYGFNR